MYGPSRKGYSTYRDTVQCKPLNIRSHALHPTLRGYQTKTRYIDTKLSGMCFYPSTKVTSQIRQDLAQTPHLRTQAAEYQTPIRKDTKTPTGKYPRYMENRTEPPVYAKADI